MPLSKLRMSDAVQVVSDSPRRLEELLCMLEERDRRIRDRAAATLAKLASLRPSRLLRSVPRLREALLDESAYVRWYLVYSMGILGTRFPADCQHIFPDLLVCLQDQNRIVRILAAKALAQIAIRNPVIIEDLFRGTEVEMPSLVAGIIRGPDFTGTESTNSGE